jgi:rubrerythrin
MSEHGNCPSCNSNLNGDLIFDTFMNKYNDRQKALETAEMYGATETEGHWGRAIGLYSLEKDRTVIYRCPDCNHQWERQ